jgi:exodeoxyribonuclease V alpha subunit
LTFSAFFLLSLAKVLIYGIGFHTADKIAQNVGVSPWSKYRYRSGLLHVLTQAADDGHCFLPRPELIQMATELLSHGGHEAEIEGVQGVIEEMAEQQQLRVDMGEGGMPLCYKPAFFVTEEHLAQMLRQMISQPLPVDTSRVRSWIDRFTQSREINLSPQQRQAVEMAAREKILILTGGPGTGKTFTVRTIVALWQAMGKDIGLAAPTGRAAQRMGEMTGLEAKTLHRMLEFSPSTMGFKRDKSNPLPFDAVVVDETSMLDLFLAHSLLKAIASDAQLLLVGDIDQLPSVGPGKVLADLLESGKIPVVRLSQVFRQAESSAIIRAAHQINRGQFPDLERISPQPQGDCLWHNGGTEPEHGVQVICELLQDFIPRQGFNVTKDVQVLCPMVRGAVGTRNLNQVLQKLINPPSPQKAEVNRGGMIFREGDRIIQLKNDYNREVFNGDLGIVEGVDVVEQELTISFDGREVVYDFADLHEITLAWSISIHKSQGSEYPVVLLPIYMTHYIMLSRNLIYTGLTRAKKLAIVIGSQKAIALAVRQVDQQQRYTRLKERLDIKMVYV